MVDAEGAFSQLSLADEDRTGILQSRYHSGIFLRNEMLHDLRTTCRGNTRRIEQILHCDRHTM